MTEHDIKNKIREIVFNAPIDETTDMDNIAILIVSDLERYANRMGIESEYTIDESDTWNDYTMKRYNDLETRVVNELYDLILNNDAHSIHLSNLKESDTKYNKRCHVCGRFVKREEWVLKSNENNPRANKQLPECEDCISNIDTGTMGY